MFGPLSHKENTRISQLPPINRARGGRLYGKDGSRWIDCWADGGRALMGHKPTGVSLRLKNEIDRGLYAPYPSLWMGKLEKTLLQLFPGYRFVRIYNDLSRAMDQCKLDSIPTDPLDIPTRSEQIDTPLWGRPLLPDHPSGPYLFPILPLPGLSTVQPVLIRDDASFLPESDTVSPIILAALNRCCHSIPGGEISQRGKSADIWERRGPYMVFQGNSGDYDNLFRFFLTRHVLIAPSFRRPSVYPLDLSSGEKGRLIHQGVSHA